MVQLPFTRKKIRKYQLECKWKPFFGSSNWKISELNGSFEKAVLFSRLERFERISSFRSHFTSSRPSRTLVITATRQALSEEMQHVLPEQTGITWNFWLNGKQPYYITLPLHWITRLLECYAIEYTRRGDKVPSIFKLVPVITTREFLVWRVDQHGKSNNNMIKF